MQPNQPISAKDLDWSKHKNLSKQTKESLTPTEYSSKSKSIQQIEKVMASHEQKLKSENPAERKEADRFLKALNSEIRHIRYTR